MMTTEVAEIVKGGKFAALFGSPEWKAELEAREARDDEEALSYLRVKFPGVEESAFFTDYRGNVSKHVSESRSGNPSGQNRAYMFPV